MGKIFISHSSANNAEALAIHDWLAAQGWGDVFLDLDPRRGLVAGDRWQAALKAAAEQCELILILISPDWAKSKWCLAEFLLAKQMNKQILGVLVRPTPLGDLPVELTAEWQLVDLSAADAGWSVTISPPRFAPETTVQFSGTGLARLAAGLQKAGLDPDNFLWPPASDPQRAPYRGLLPLDADDAGIFFGRDGAIVLTLDALRGLRAAAPPRFVTILGASGAGKSSFLRAGLLPRLDRDSRHFYVLPVVRPERAALTGEHGFAAMLELALKARNLTRNRADLRDAALAGAAAVAPILKQLAIAEDSGDGDADGPPTLVIAIDQAEELLTADNAEAGQLLTLLADLGRRDDPAVLVILTVRSDSFDQLQARPELAPTQPHHLVDLPPVPFGSFGDIIRGPARRVTAAGRKLSLDETLVDALLGDIERGGAKDALPLLAFTLERLYRDYGADGDLRLSEYERLGRIRGAIEAAVEQALAKAGANPAIPRDRAARLALLRRGLIPWLAGIDPDTGSPRRRVARLAEVPEEARPLIELMVAERLLATDIDKQTGERTIEPAHEALLRQWGALDGWLVEDSADLGLVEALRRAATDWAANANASEYVVHKGARLATAEQLAAAEKFAAYLTSVDRAYLAAARALENAAARAARTARTRLTIAAAIAGVVLVAGLTAGWFIWSGGEAAKLSAASSFNTARSEAALRAGQPEEATRFALAAYDTVPTPAARTAALNAGALISPNIERIVPTPARLVAAAWTGDTAVRIFGDDGAVTSADLASPKLVTVLEPAPRGIPILMVADRLFFRDASIAGLDGKPIAAAPGGDFAARSAPAASADGKVAIFRGLIGDTLVRDCRSLPCIDAPLLPPAGMTGDAEQVAVSPDGAKIFAIWDGGTLATYTDFTAVPAAAPLPAWPAADASVEAFSVSSRGVFAFVLASGTLVTLDPASGRPSFPATIGALLAPVWSPSGDRLAVACDGNGICLRDRSGQRLDRFAGHVNPITSLAWSPDGRHLLSTAGAEPIRIWSMDEAPGLLTTLKTGAAPDLLSLAVDRERQLVAAGDASGRLWVWDATGKVTLYNSPEAISSKPVKKISSVAFLSDGRLGAVYENLGVGIFTLGIDTPDRFIAVENATFSRIAALSGDIRAAVPLTDKSIVVLSGADLRETRVVPDSTSLTPWGLTAADAANTAYISYSDGSIRRRDLGAMSEGTTVFDASQPVCGVATAPDNNGSKSLDVSADGKWLADTRADARIVLHNLVQPLDPLCITLLAPDSRTVAFSPDSKRLAVLSATDRLYVFDLASPDNAVILGAQLVADLPSYFSHPLGPDALRQTSWLDWVDDQRLAVSVVDGRVLELALDPAGWRARVDGVFMTP